MRNLDPLPGSLSTARRPPPSSTMAFREESPRPVPLPGGLVVKKGSKIRSRVSGAMPTPVSTTSIMAWSVSGTPGPAWMVRRPPSGMASRALATRFTSICSSLSLELSTIRAFPDRIWIRRSTERGRRRRRMASISFTTPPRSMGDSCSTSRRTKPISRRVRCAARSAVEAMRARSSGASGRPASRFMAASSAELFMAHSRLLRSWASPAPMRATVFMRSVLRRVSWARSRASVRCRTRASRVRRADWRSWMAWNWRSRRSPTMARKRPRAPRISCREARGRSTARTTRAATTGRYGSSLASLCPESSRTSGASIGRKDQAASPWKRGIPPASRIQPRVAGTGGSPARAQQDSAASQANAEAPSHPSGPRMRSGWYEVMKTMPPPSSAAFR